MTLKSFISAGIIAAIATTTSASTARAASDADKIAALILGAGVLAVIAKNSRDDNKVTQQRHNHHATPHRYNTTPRYTRNHPQQRHQGNVFNQAHCKHHVHGGKSHNGKKWGQRHNCTPHGHKKPHHK